MDKISFGTSYSYPVKESYYNTITIISSSPPSLHCVGDVYWEIVEGGRGVPVVVVIISGGDLGVGWGDKGG